MTIKRIRNKLKKSLAKVSYQKIINVSKKRKIVSFTFDDAPASAFLNGGEILKKYNVNGTFYISLSFINNLYTREHLKKCISEGNELASHTYNHCKYYDIASSSFILNDLHKNQSEFEGLDLGGNFKNFSYPFGEQTMLSKNIISKMYISSRGIDDGINIGKVDLNNLRAIKLYEKANNSLDIVFSKLNRFNETGGWLIFYTHDIQSNFSKFGCSSEYFEKVVEKCISMGYEIMTVDKAVSEVLL